MAVTTIPSAGLTLGSQVNFRNLIINGDMSIAQRGTSATTISGYDTIDRFGFSEGTGGTATSEQESLSLSDFATTGQRKAIKIKCTGTDTSIASGDRSFMQQSIEAQNLQSLKYGTSSAETLTLSFYAKSNLTGNFPLTIKKDDNTVYYLPLKYTITSANTWEKFTFQITPTEGSTSLINNSGGAINNDNGRGMQVFWGLVWGSNYTGNQSGTPTWTSSAVYADSSLTFNNFYSSTDNNLSITGVQLEVGTSASDFEFLPFDVNFDRCMRYYHKTYDDTTAPGTVTTVGAVQTGTTATSTFVPMQYFYPVRMRSAPTFTAYSPATGTSGKFASNAPSGDHNIGTGRIGVSNANFSSSTTSVSATGYIEAHFEADSEL